MSDKPSPRSPAPKPTAKTAGGATSTGGKGAGSKSPTNDDPDDQFDFLQPSVEDGELGRLANYRVLKVLGRGGMGIVFMAEDMRLHRIVALKVMLPSIAKKAAAHDRFLREARATAAIEHDHIVTIYEVNEDNEVPYLAMQFLKGMTVDDWLKAGKSFNIPQIMRVGKEIAKALAAAHACQLIHRDIKPSNIWLDATNKGRVKILDFGLARPTNEETHLTQEGTILGSPAYMSPEQARGQNIDERCDLFSLGCVLYRLCSGRLPFSGKDAMSVLLAITCDEPTPVRTLNGDLPAGLADLIHQLLAKKPEDRPASAKDVVQRIQELEREWIANSKTLVDQKPMTPKPEEPTVAEPALAESVITEMELAKSDPSATKPTPAQKSSPRRGPWIFAGIGCSLLTAMTLVCCLAIFFVNNQGQVTVVPEGEAANGLIDAGGLSVRDHNKKVHTLKAGSQSLPAGGYTVEIDRLPKGWQVDPATFAIGRLETVEIKVQFVHPKSSRPEIGLLTADEAKRTQKKWAAYLGRDVIEAHGFLPKMVLIPSGEFVMGSTKEQLPRKIDKTLQYRLNGETPAHKVRISKPFYIAANEVTLGQFKQFITSSKYKAQPQPKGGTGIVDGHEAERNLRYTLFDPGYTPGDEHPVTNITWKDAEAYCAWLTRTESRVVRLPTEAEWEYACRGGTTTSWFFGEDLKGARASMWFHWPTPIPPKVVPNAQSPMPVGRKRANEFGLFDMHGNVAEMCADFYDPRYYELCSKEGTVVDPKGPPRGQARCVRGGSFVDIASMTRSASRYSADPTLSYATIGFRVVCEIAMPPE